MINSPGFNDNVPAANAGMASIHHYNPIRDIGKVAGPMKSCHAGVSKTSVTYPSLLGRSYSCCSICENAGTLSIFSKRDFKGK